jgi:subtilisin family serine protease
MGNSSPVSECLVNATGWHLNSIGAYDAWDYGRAESSVIVAVIETGADSTHPDLQSRIYMPHDVVYNQPGVDHGGTCVADIIAAQTNNGVGVAGVSCNAKIMPINATSF